MRVEPAKQVAEDRWDTGAYDWQTLGLLADTVKVPAPVDPRAYVPDGQLDALLDYATGQINRYKLQPILSGQSIEQSGNYLLQKKYSDALTAAPGPHQDRPDRRRAGQAAEPGARLIAAEQRPRL